ncbi:MAG: D-alanyl-D-alanine carboxypeptidase family protein [Rhodobacterales bacterium]|tara:strand:+ start:1 stop:1146 length:1146 start_codon:yes stop_codon:yes gene_type:complete
MKYFARLSFVTILLCLPTQIIAFETSAKAAYIIDLKTNAVLLSKNPDEPMPPASLSKLMTLNMVFEALEDGRLSLDDKLPVSRHAEKYKGSTMFLTTRHRPTVKELIMGVVVLSGNDASAVLAEALSPDGTENGFANLMTRRAKQLGMNNSTFGNSNGWPHPKQLMSAKDLAIIAARIINEFPEYYTYFAQREFTYDNITQPNRNPLLKLGLGADGLKTGWTQRAGYGIVGSALQDGRRVVFVLTGIKSPKIRAREAEKINNWVFRQFTEKKLFSAGDLLHMAPVHLGKKNLVRITVKDDLMGLVPSMMDGEIKAEIIYKSPIKAPITEGQEIGEIIITIPSLVSFSKPIIAAESIEDGGFLARLKFALIKTQIAIFSEEK